MQAQVPALAMHQKLACFLTKLRHAVIGEKTWKLCDYAMAWRRLRNAPALFFRKR
jgi:hypothetical protein